MKKSALTICVGAQKAGTSWLFRCLQEHTSICCAPQKEIHFFDKPVYQTGAEGYLEHFTTCAESPVLFESTASYLHTPGCAEKIANLFPKANIILLLRDPVERSVSHYYHQKSKSRVSGTLFEAIDTCPDILLNSQYTEQVADFKKYFPAEQILIMDYRKISTHPQELLNQVCTFLQIPTFIPNRLHDKYNSQSARSHPLFNVITKTYFRLQKNWLGSKTIQACKAIGIDNNLIENLLQKTNRKKDSIPNEDMTELREKLASETAFYQKISG